MKLSRNLLIQAFLFVGIIFYLVLKPGVNHSRDDGMARSFKMPLIALLQSGKQQASLAELYAGTLFEGNTMCMFYPYPGIQQTRTAAQKLVSYFPHRINDISKMKLRYEYPEWLVAIESDDGVTAVMGTRQIGEKSHIKVEKTYIDGKGVEKRFSSSDEGNACFSFDTAIVRVDKNGTRPPVLVFTEPLPPSTP